MKALSRSTGGAFAFALLLFLLLAAVLPQALALQVPPLTGRVNDLAGILSPASTEMLTRNLEALEREELTQIAVLIVPSLEGDSLEQFSLRVAESWKLGQKGRDNGALLLIAVNDRKLRIETGYGLEGVLTDLVAGRIIRDVIVPEFRRGNLDQGVINGVGSMIAVAKGEFKEAAVSRSSERTGDPVGLFAILFIGLLCIGNLFRRQKAVASGVGGLFAPVAGFLFPSLPGWMPILLLVPVGLVGGLIAAYMAGTSSGRYRDSGGFYPSGGGIGGGGGLGGFSGGGGGFGGGGASGGW